MIEELQFLCCRKRRCPFSPIHITHLHSRYPSLQASHHSVLCMLLLDILMEQDHPLIADVLLLQQQDKLRCVEENHICIQVFPCCVDSIVEKLWHWDSFIYVKPWDKDAEVNLGAVKNSVGLTDAKEIHIQYHIMNINKWKNIYIIKSQVMLQHVAIKLQNKTKNAKHSKSIHVHTMLLSFH